MLNPVQDAPEMPITSWPPANAIDHPANLLDSARLAESGETVLLWPTPIYLARNGRVDNGWHARLVDEVMQRISTGRNFRGDWADSDLFAWAEQPGEDFRRFIMSHLHRAISYYRPGWSFRVSCQLSAWVNVKTSASWHQPHIHENSTLSYVYYLLAPAVDAADIKPELGEVGGGVLQLNDPRGAAPYMSCQLSSVFSSAVRIAPAAGLLLIFPSYLVHFVAPSDKNEPRISIAGNIFALEPGA